MVSPLPMMIPLKTCDHQLEYDIKFHKRKKGYFQQNSGITLSQSTRSERLSSKSVADLKPESIRIHFLPIYRIYVNIFNTWYAYNIMHAMPCLMFLARWVCQINALSYPTLRYSIKTAGVWKSWEFLSQQSLIRDFGWEWDSFDFAHTVGPPKKVMIMVTALLPIIFIFALSIPDGLEVKSFGKFQNNFFAKISGLWFCWNFRAIFFVFRLVVLSMLASTND